MSPMSTAPPPRPDVLGYLHPRDEAELAHLLATTRAPVRVRGAAHSVPAAIHTDARLRGAPAGGLDLVLDRLDTMVLDPVDLTVTVGAGVRFGHDPLDPHARDPDRDGLLPFLEARGRALVNTGGITHQTVAGFLATGSAGGSARHDLHADVVSIRLLDARGGLHVIDRADPRFPAALVHLGLLGVVTAVTLRTHPRFDVVGSESVMPETGDRVDLFAEGPTGLAHFLTETPYARVLWWPQRGVEQIAVWEARPATPSDGPAPPWRPMPPVFGSTLPTQAAAGLALRALTHWRGAVGRVAPGAVAPLARGMAPLRPALYRSFLGPPHQAFRGAWHTTLPLDREMSDRLLPTTFTEIWIPLDHAAEALRRLRAAFDAGGDAAAGRFAIELYAGPPAAGWLAPGHGGPHLRINPFWFEGSPGDPRDDFFPRMWDALADLDLRLHWGKLLPHDPASLALAGRYPHLADFEGVRRGLDPEGRFLTDTWRAALGLGPAPIRPPAPLPHNRATARTPSITGPLPFRFAPTDDGLVDRADVCFRLHAHTRADPTRALHAFFPEDGRLAGRLVRGMAWSTPVGELSGAVIEERLPFMALRMRVLDHVPGRRLVVEVEACTLPLAREMVQVIEVRPDGGRTRIDWVIALTVPGPIRPVQSLLQPPFAAMFRSLLDAIAAAADAGAP